jgi:hypothetical protein
LPCRVGGGQETQGTKPNMALYDRHKEDFRLQAAARVT